MPVSGYGGMLIVKKAGEAVSVQLFVRNANASTDMLFCRASTSHGVWREWKKLI